jgi:hypothetical protein
MDPDGKTILLYTPKIKRGSQVGSQAKVLSDNNSTDDIYYSSERFIKDATVSNNGQFIILITAKEGTDDMAIILDRYGNELNSISTEEDLLAGYFTSNNRQFIIHSSRRTIVYSTLSGERIGSTSFRSPLILAQYFSEDHTIVGVTGNKVENTEIYQNLEFHAINLEQREIARREFSGALGASPNISIQFLREARGQYTLKGMNKIINLRASF